jgi:MFS family permease
MATWMDSVARGWLIYELTNSSFQLGLVRGVQALPILFLSPIAGSTADLYSRKKQVMIAQIVDGLLYAAVAMLIVTGDIQAWHVYATSIGLATVQTFQQPSRASMIFGCGAARISDYCYRPQCDSFQCRANRRARCGGRSDCGFWHRRIV